MVAVRAAGVAALDLASALDADGVDVANENSPDQVVLSGPQSAMDRACERTRELAGAIEIEFVPLTVSAPFHSRRMRAVEADFRLALDEAAPRLSAERAAAVTSNFRGGFHTGRRDDLLDALERQIGGTVRWTANMRALLPVADRIFEVGPGDLCAVSSRASASRSRRSSPARRPRRPSPLEPLFQEPVGAHPRRLERLRPRVREEARRERDERRDRASRSKRSDGGDRAGVRRDPRERRRSAHVEPRRALERGSGRRSSTRSPSGWPAKAACAFSFTRSRSAT